ncbi:hypothetical protein E4U55_002290 [Claviceps digitariae]|nr:hypothetical protein E4U55_002290 [Claviceps digitariae]
MASCNSLNRTVWFELDDLGFRGWDADWNAPDGPWNLSDPETSTVEWICSYDEPSLGPIVACGEGEGGDT